MSLDCGMKLVPRENPQKHREDCGEKPGFKAQDTASTIFFTVFMSTYIKECVGNTMSGYANLSQHFKVHC